MTEERAQCEYVSPLDGNRCVYFASGHRTHVVPEDGDPPIELRESPEDNPDWDPEGIKSWEKQRGQS